MCYYHHSSYYYNAFPYLPNVQKRKEKKRIEKKRKEKNRKEKKRIEKKRKEKKERKTKILLKNEACMHFLIGSYKHPKPVSYLTKFLKIICKKHHFSVLF